jgi:hypothetical protein
VTNRLQWLTDVAIPETEHTLRILRHEALALLVHREVKLQVGGEVQLQVGGAKTADASSTLARPAIQPTVATPVESVPEAAPEPKAPKGRVKGLVDGYEGRVYRDITCACHCGCRAEFKPAGPRSRYCIGCASCPRVYPRASRTMKTCACACGCKAEFAQGRYYAVNCDGCRRNPECRNLRVRARTPERPKPVAPEPERTLVPAPPPSAPTRVARTVVVEGNEYEVVWSGGEGLTAIDKGGSSLLGG